MFQNLLKIWMLVWGEADSETSRKRSIGRKLLNDMLHELGEVNLTHANYNGSRISKDTEDPSWSTSVKTRRQRRHLQHWKRFGRLYFVVFCTC
ncbi:hypothetical protein Tco_0415426 [Tanacetum coccineum]